MTKTFLKKRLGQNTAEYLVLLVLVTVGSIGVFTVFGDTVRKQIGNVVGAMTGESSDYDTQSLKDNAKEASDRAKKAVSMNGIEKDEISYKK